MVEVSIAVVVFAEEDGGSVVAAAFSFGAASMAWGRSSLSKVISSSGLVPSSSPLMESEARAMIASICRQCHREQGALKRDPA